MDGPINVAHVSFDADVEQLVLQVLRSGHVAQGPVVEALENAVSDLLGVDHVVAMSNGTASLVAALHLAGIGHGDEVVTSPFTFGATLQAILAVGATARFADISADDFTLSPSSVESLVNHRTAAIMPVHLFGQTADMTELGRVAAAHDLALVEDAAQALGARHRGRSAGTFGIGSFSLYATKNVTTGEGGLLTTDDSGIARAARRLRNQGMDRPYEYHSFGLNLRLTDLQAAVGLPQLQRFAESTARRIENATRLSASLADIQGLVCPVVRPGNDHVFHQYVVRVDESARCDRAALQRHLAAGSVATAIHYPELLTHSDYFAADPLVTCDPCPVAEMMTRQVLSLPVHPHLDGSDLDRISELIHEALT